MGYIKKADYIAKYGEEAWDAYAEKRREYSKQYYQENREHIAKQVKQYCQEHKEERKEYRKQYYQDNKEHYAEWIKQYYQDNKEYFADYYKQYYQDNKEHLDEYSKQYRSTQWGRAKYLKGRYIQTDKEKGLSTDQNIDEDWIIENIFNSSCTYCGDTDWEHLGADRIDNTKGHTPDNCVCACEKCNKGRNNRYSVQDFIKIKQEKIYRVQYVKQ